MKTFSNDVYDVNLVCEFQFFDLVAACTCLNWIAWRFGGRAVESFTCHLRARNDTKDDDFYVKKKTLTGRIRFLADGESYE